MEVEVLASARAPLQRLAVAGYVCREFRSGRPDYAPVACDRLEIVQRSFFGDVVGTTGRRRRGWKTV